ncbi:SGNH/GDSL hydrolase family protein [Saccharopolyspora gloriosae]|uniref:Lysophospholipase L1-like esterase n=1 Tax=Saccharopolyspora gloriosae TaxID=455344 RepID=A0A840NRU3_9PSEU|nr:SGNH/GDSL hydrolase family protein [Saccharopolyspora gloriosae]MBB5072665.1 lysophospholipase L1-like esterase [Saccharopolyspora gloriosae]
MFVRRWGVVCAVVVACGAAPVVADAAEPLDYVALGDSAAAGPLIPGPDPNLACLRSTRNYPRVTADALGARLTDATCSGAEIEDFTGRQHGFLPPQFDALSAATDLVTVTIGGNDVDLVGAAVSCLNAFPEPFGKSCADEFTQDGRDELSSRIAGIEGDLDAALTGITDRAPNAKVVVAGYGTYIRPGGCYPKEPIWARDADYVQSSVDELSDLLRDRAAAHGAEFVDIGAVSEGHDVCAAPQDKYLEGVLPTSVAAPLHPNARGMAAFGRAIAESVREGAARTPADDAA